MQLKNMYGKEGSSHRQRACKRHICAYELCTLYMRVLLHSWAYTVEPGENLTSPCFFGPNSWRDATQTNLKVPGPWEQICCPSFSPLSYFWPSFSRKFFQFSSTKISTFTPWVWVSTLGPLWVHRHTSIIFSFITIKERSLHCICILTDTVLPCP